MCVHCFGSSCGWTLAAWRGSLCVHCSALPQPPRPFASWPTDPPRCALGAPSRRGHAAWWGRRARHCHTPCRSCACRPGPGPGNSRCCGGGGGARVRAPASERGCNRCCGARLSNHFAATGKVLDIAFLYAANDSMRDTLPPPTTCTSLATRCTKYWSWLTRMTPPCGASQTP